MVQSNFRLWENEWYQYQIGLFEEDEFEPRIQNWASLFENLEGYVTIWEGSGQYYAVEFREVIDSLILENVNSLSN